MIANWPILMEMKQKENIRQASFYLYQPLVRHRLSLPWRLLKAPLIIQVGSFEILSNSWFFNVKFHNLPSTWQCGMYWNHNSNWGICQLDPIQILCIRFCPNIIETKKSCNISLLWLCKSSLVPQTRTWQMHIPPSWYMGPSSTLTLSYHIYLSDLGNI